jgi:nicotinate-nucleotide pyrophosphorylase (carboxylating)
MKIEVEVSNQSQVREAVAGGADVVKLENMLIDEIREAAKWVRDEAPGVVIEVSGGVGLDNVRDIAQCGVDLISIGEITQSVTAVDILLKTRPI